MRYLGSTLFGKCSSGDHRGCLGIDVDPCDSRYIDCSCECHHAAESGAWSEERGAPTAKPSCLHEPGPMSCLVYHGDGVPSCRACKKCGEWIGQGHRGQERWITVPVVSDKCRAVLGLDGVDAKRAGPF